jgi:membrane protease YdiL (CAAX protease family)
MGWLLVGALLFLRIPFEGGIRALMYPDFPDWVWWTYEVGTYGLTAVLIVWEGDRLGEFHITRLTLALFALGPVLEPGIHWLLDNPTRLAWSQLTLVPQIAISIAMMMLLARRHRHDLRPARDRFMAVGLGLFAGLILGALTGLAFEYQRFGRVLVLDSITKNQGSLATLAALVVLQLNRAALVEEPVFRGFLWGYLRLRGWRDGRIWLLQAALFLLAHMYYFGNNPLSTISVAVAGLTFGWLAWRTRSVAACALSHALANAIGGFIPFYNLNLG